MFKVGDEVSYGLHGKCVITGIETKTLSSGEVSFYQVRQIKNPIIAKSASATKPSRNEPSILIPVDTAASKGLRRPMTRDEAEAVLRLLAEPDYHFELNQNWGTRQKTLEDAIRKEGAVGMAKVVGHLYVVARQDAVPPSEVQRFYDSTYRIFAREIAEALGLTSKEVEPILTRALKSKLSRDS